MSAIKNSDSGNALFVREIVKAYFSGLTKHAIILFSFLCLFICSCNKIDNSNNSDKRIMPFIRQANLIVDTSRANNGLAYIDSCVHGLILSSVETYEVYAYKCRWNYQKVGKYDMANTYADSMLWVLSTNEIISDTERLFRAYTNKGDISLKIKNFPQATKYYYLSERVADKSPCRQGGLLFRIAMSLFHQEKYLVAAHVFIQSYEKSMICDNQDFGFDFRLQENLANIGESYLKANMPDSAIYYYRQALSFIEVKKVKSPDKLRNWNDATSVILGNLGESYRVLNNLDSAEALLLRSIELNKGTNLNYTERQYNLIKLANLYLQKANLTKAFTTILEEAELNRTNPKAHYRDDSMDLEYKRTEFYYQYYATQKDFKSAFEYLSMLHDLQDKNKEEVGQLITHDVQKGIDNYSDDTKILLLETESKIKSQKYVIAILSIAVFLLLAVWTFIILRKRIVEYRKLHSEGAIRENELNKRIAEQRKNYLALLENTEDLMWSIGTDFKFLAFNKAFNEYIYSICGEYPKVGELEPMAIHYPMYYEKLVVYYKQVLSTGERIKLVTKAMVKFGNTQDIDVRLIPIMDSTGEIKGVACLRRDITEYLDLIRNLEGANEKLKDVAFVQSHKLRGPMVTIKGILYYLGMPNIDTKQKDELFSSLKEKVEEMDLVVHEIVKSTEEGA